MSTSRGKSFVIRCNAIHDFSVSLRKGSNPADINRFGSHTGINVYLVHPAGPDQRRLVSNN